jgi:hypothetical protein
MSSVAAYPAYPARMEARMDQPLSRWLWLVKWVLVIPHVIVLVFLWTAFAVLSVVAFVAILCTGRYPRGIFDVAYPGRLSRGLVLVKWWLLFTDSYPPFRLDMGEHEPGGPEPGGAR